MQASTLEITVRGAAGRFGWRGEVGMGMGTEMSFGFWGGGKEMSFGFWSDEKERERERGFV